jgi:hypothetical protein
VTYRKIREEIVSYKGGGQIVNLVSKGIDTLLETEEYIQNFHLADYERASYEIIRKTPERLKKNIKDIDRIYDYDFKLLYKTEKEMQNIDRRRALSGVFYKICGSEEGKRCHELMLQFLHRISVHNPLIQPVYEDNSLVTDPLILLELGEMRCGHVARLTCDLFNSVGYETRLVQLGGHVIAEIWYDNAWHYFDANIFSKGETVYIDGKIPSIEELSYRPFLIDSLNTSHFEMSICSAGDQELYPYSLYPSSFYFNVNNYRGRDCYIYIKTATEMECLDKKYGWTFYKTVKDENRVLYNSEIKYEPSVPKIKEVIYNKASRNIWIKWENSQDNNEDLLGYQIFVGSRSRNYDYDHFIGEEKAKEYWSGPYNDSMYEDVGNLPNADIGKYKTEDTEIEIEIGRNYKVVYVTIMPYDKHGVEAGRSVFKVSNELKIIMDR